MCASKNKGKRVFLFDYLCAMGGFILFLTASVIGLFCYAMYRLAKFFIGYQKDSAVEKPEPNPLIQAHLLDKKNKETYQEYVRWAEENDETIIWDFESFQDKAKRKQEQKIKNLFK